MSFLLYSLPVNLNCNSNEVSGPAPTRQEADAIFSPNPLHSFYSPCLLRISYIPSVYFDVALCIALAHAKVPCTT